ncbi:MAG TPA: DUF4342 domain-containing protein [Bacillota bacterium]|nr:DUF4342 domain-containing protein [Bacillota bacterium]
MSANLDQIEILRERANISYGEAKEVLEKFNNDVVEALIFLESQQKIRGTHAGSAKGNCCSASKGVFKTGKNLLKRGNEIKFVVKKADNTVVNLPLNLALLGTLVAPPVALVGVLAAFATGHEVRFNNLEGDRMGINKTMEKISTTVSSVTDQVVEAIKKEEQ